MKLLDLLKKLEEVTGSVHVVILNTSGGGSFKSLNTHQEEFFITHQEGEDKVKSAITLVLEG